MCEINSIDEILIKEEFGLFDIGEETKLAIINTLVDNLNTSMN